MTTLYVLDVPENQGVADVANDDDTLHVGHVGPYFAISSDDIIVIDRRATGCRHAVWYSAVAGISAGTITQWDKDALRVEPAGAGTPARSQDRRTANGFQDAGLPA